MTHELMLGCPWAQNRSKLERAIKEVRGDNNDTGMIGRREVTEEAVKEVYIRLLGHVLDTKEQVQNYGKMKVEVLRKIAEEKGIDVEGLTKAEIVEALK